MKIYNSNPQIHYQDRYNYHQLAFECLKIVEFNFNSHVFLVMYQEIRFLNQDACKMQERRQFLMSSVSERDWKRERRLESFKRWLLIVSYLFYIPNANKFFEGLLSLLQYCGDCVKENTDGGHAECLARRQEEYQRTLCDLWVMYGRVTESAQENQHTQDLELLMQIMNSRLQSLAKPNSDFDYTLSLSLTGIRLSPKQATRVSNG